MGYDPKVSGPWSDTDEYPPEAPEPTNGVLLYEERMRLLDQAEPVGPVGYGLGGPPSWIGRGLFYWGYPWGGKAIGFGVAIALAIALIVAGVGAEFLLIWLTGGAVL